MALTSSMKVSLALSCVILLAGAALAWRDHETLQVLRKDHEVLLREASELGIRLDAEGNNTFSKQLRGKRDDLTERENKAREFSKRLTAFAVEMEAAQKGGKDDDTLRPRIFAMISEMLSLDASQLKVVVAELRNNRGVSEEIRNGIIGFAIMTMAETQPENALALITESSDMTKGGGHVVTEALNRWAVKDPVAALGWIRENSAKYPELIGDRAKQGVLSGAAKQDPKLAFQMIQELGFKDSRLASEAITRAANTPEAQLAVLSALREHVNTMTDAAVGKSFSDTTLQQLASSVVRDGYTSATAWLEKAKLGPEEKIEFAQGLRYYETKENTGKWLEWMGKEDFSQAQAKNTVEMMVQQWTSEDHKAVGTWLNESADNQVRQVATRTYAQQVAPYEPQTAALWAKTLPPGKERTETMERIYREWKKQDEAAAAAFAREQGVEK